MFHYVVAFILTNYIKIVLKTSHITHDLPSDAAPHLQGEKPAIFAIWHHQILLIPSLNHQLHHNHNQRNIVMHAIISNHNDGRLIGRVLRSFGLQVVYGSSSNGSNNKGGANALRKLIHIYENGGHLAITPDGPRGPNQVARAGVAQLAMLTNAPVICISCASSRHIRLNSWDRFMITLPFSRLHFTYSSPIFADINNVNMVSANMIGANMIGANKTHTQSPKEYRETLRLQIEKQLNDLGKAAEKFISERKS